MPCPSELPHSSSDRPAAPTTAGMTMAQPTRASLGCQTVSRYALAASPSKLPAVLQPRAMAIRRTAVKWPEGPAPQRWPLQVPNEQIRPSTTTSASAMPNEAASIAIISPEAWTPHCGPRLATVQPEHKSMAESSRKRGRASVLPPPARQASTSSASAGLPSHGSCRRVATPCALAGRKPCPSFNIYSSGSELHARRPCAR
mmetsp:Transcript_14678/g.37699  ORF Transcript_14678/g.37699 Transcript_14678/m.37699 type:complete len:201 (+) Transcript_14678:574-1176(+)